MLQTLNLAQAYPDSKTIVDKPTKVTEQKAVDDYGAFAKNTADITYQQVVDYLNTDFVSDTRAVLALACADPFRRQVRARSSRRCSLTTSSTRRPS